MPPSQKRVGFIGISAQGSWASRSHLGYLTNTPHYAITALQNRTKESAEAAAKQYSLPNVSAYDDPASLANDPNVDIVAVSVKVPDHYRLIKTALEAGKDVFAEWPLARNLSEAEELTKLAKEKGVRTMVGLQARQSPAIIKAKEIVESGKLGKILASSMYGHGWIFGPTIHSGFLYALPVESGANLVTIPFGHAIDALCFVLGEIDTLSATLANGRPELDLVDEEGKVIKTVTKTAHDHVSIIGTLVSGGVIDATYAGGTSRTGRDFYWEINGTEGSLILKADNGHIQMYELSLEYVAGDGKKTSEVKQETGGEKGLMTGDFVSNVGKAWDAFAGEGLDQGHSVTTFEDATRRHRMIEAIYRSAEKGTMERYL